MKLWSKQNEFLYCRKVSEASKYSDEIQVYKRVLYEALSKLSWAKEPFQNIHTLPALLMGSLSSNKLAVQSGQTDNIQPNKHVIK